MTERQIREIEDRASDAFDPLERRALELAERMTATPVDVGRELVDTLRTQLGDRGVVELAAAIAWENWRARFNHALGVESEGYAESASCPLPAALERERSARVEHRGGERAGGGDATR